MHISLSSVGTVPIVLLILLAPLAIHTSFTFDASSSLHQYDTHAYRYPIPDFVYRSIPKDVPDAIRDGILLSYVVATEGIVLLKNNGVLPLRHGTRVAIFGRSQHWTWLYHLGGSAFVTVSPEREISLLEGLVNAGIYVDRYAVEKYNSTPIGWMFPFTEDEVREIASRNDVAIIVISRFMSEDLDIPRSARNATRYIVEGMWWGRKTVPVYGYTLTDDEKRMIDIVTRYFNKTIVVLNTGNAIDIGWDSEKISAVVWVGYPGEQGGNAIASMLLGLVNPSGRLPFTWAKRYEDYPSAGYFGTLPDVVYYEDIYVGYRYFDTFGIEPKYPFGYGLSYTKFKIDVLNLEVQGETARIRIRIENTGGYPGREVVQVYVSCPNGKLEKPYQQLVAFAKTDLLEPGSSQMIEISFSLRNLASYDEEESAWILEKGMYIVRVGNSSRSTSVVAVLELLETVIVEDTVNRMHAPTFERLSRYKVNVESYSYPGEDLEVAKAPRIPVNPSSFRTINVSMLVESHSPEFVVVDAGSRVIKLEDVYRDEYSLKQLVAQMSIEEMANLVIGLRGMSKYGIPELRHADGPNGLRSGASPNPGGTAFPSANILAASWDLELANEVGRQIGRELVWADIVLWLAPGLNILRNPLQGRSGEYYSEDPILAGVMGAAVVKGLQGIDGVGATVKHLVGNEQEYGRYISNSIISERALREIYLKPFEIVVKLADPWSVMTSYNKVNSVYTGNDINLCIGILRIEWGFKGFVMTDWWSASYNFYAIAAGNDALMPWDPNLGPTTISSIVKAVKNGELSLGQLHRSVYNILKVAIRSRAFAKMINIDQKDLYRYSPPPDYIRVDKMGVIVVSKSTEVVTTTVLQMLTTTYSTSLTVKESAIEGDSVATIISTRTLTILHTCTVTEKVDTCSWSVPLLITGSAVCISLAIIAIKRFPRQTSRLPKAVKKSI